MPAGLLPRRLSGMLRYVVLVALILCAFFFFGQSSYDIPSTQFPRPFAGKPSTKNPKEPVTQHSQGQNTKDTSKGNTPGSPANNKPHGGIKQQETGKQGPHPIDKLIYNAENVFAELLSKESKTLNDAAQAYRKRHNRHPPPGFDQWYKFAVETNTLVVEDFFDPIYQDLGPFWGMEPSQLRKESWDYEMTINIRNGTATAGSDWFWTVIWLNLTKSIEKYLPDVDLPLNAMDEPRLVSPWEDVNDFMKKAAKTTGLTDPKTVKTEYQKLPDPGKGDRDVESRRLTWEGGTQYWRIAKRGCPPDSLAQKTPIQDSFANPPKISLANTKPHSPDGYVANYTLSSDLCHQPDLQGLEGALIHPISTKTSKQLRPMFAGSKLSVSNEILLPPPMYWNEEERFTGGDDHGISWSDKITGAIWRGVATGGTNTADNWRGFQRHRFIAMNNGTKATRVQSGKDRAENFALPDEMYELHAQKQGKFGQWVNEWSNVSFVDLFCAENTECNYVAPHFRKTEGMPMARQFDYKYLPDLDGNSFSGRYLGFLRSTSLPIKATIFREWHDSRIIPWKHFVPMDNRFTDYFGIMEYFLGFEGKHGHDQAAEKIANSGKEWAEKVLRKEDMQVYVMRLIMEYARLLDDNREKLGWVDDVLKNPDLAKAWANW